MDSALYVSSVHRAILVGGGQEGGIRAGTENMLHIVALGSYYNIVNCFVESV